MIDNRHNNSLAFGRKQVRSQRHYLEPLHQPLLTVRQRSEGSCASSDSRMPSGLPPKKRRSVRFSNNFDDPDHVTTFIKYVEPITDPQELARVHSSRLELRLYKANARSDVRQIATKSHDLIMKLHNVFFGPRNRGNAERMFDLVLEWCQDDNRRGLERHVFLMGGGARRRSNSQCWAQFLAVADCVVVHGTQKVVEDADIRDAAL